jgi:uncharacterized protein (DUF58 family)
MDTRELLQKIRTIPIHSGSLAEQLLSGNFRSVFKGQGIEFDEVRHYQSGDDIRSIDWNASARCGTPFVKLFREERDLTILILMDTSASMHRDRQRLGAGGAGQRLTPYEQGVLAAALIAFSAERKSQRVGALLFDRDIHRVFLPRKGRSHLMALIGAVLQHQDTRNNGVVSHNKDAVVGSNVAAALSGADKLLKRRSLVVLISDFVSVNWEDPLARLCRGHDVIALRVGDPGDTDLPRGLTVMEDPETGVRITAPAKFESFRDAWKEWHAQRLELWDNTCRRAGAAHLDLPVTADAASALYRFFSAGASAGHRFSDARLSPQPAAGSAGLYQGDR